MSKQITRRTFIYGSAAAPMVAMAAQSTNTPVPANPAAGNWLRWLDGAAAPLAQGLTWGTAWPRGKQRESKNFALRSADQNLHALQSWPLAWWPDGSLKWTAHALPPVELGDGPFEVLAQRKAGKPAVTLSVKQSDAAIEVDTGVIRCRFPRSGSRVIAAISRGGQEALRNGRLVLLRQDGAASSEDAQVSQQSFQGVIEKATVENQGPARVLIKIEGKHADANRRWLPFTLRVYLYAGSDNLRVLHTIVFDGDEAKDFIRGIGLRFDVPQSAELYDRHVRFAGDDDGLFGEAVRGLTGLRRDPGTAARDAQVAGLAANDIAPVAKSLLRYIPAFGDWTLSQPNANGFTIRKRTADGHAWLDSGQGHRASGLGYVGSPSGGVAFGIRNFWQSHPAQLDIRHADSDAATVTMWVWAPDAAPMDLRFYHDGLGQDTYEKQYKGGLEITYEDYEPGFGTPMGVARTSELQLWVLPATPPRDRFPQLARALRAPAVLAATPQTLAESGVFAHSVALPSQTAGEHAGLEKQLQWMVDFYRGQQEQHGWYGYWNFGDVMHTYDFDRHAWRYDVGGFAWDNSELATDVWLWMHYLRTGSADAFRFAEAMTRHTGEVDVHHLGKFAPLGSRHNVQHWGCSAKQLRISTALNRRFFYYLTADERVGDLMREQNEAARTLRTVPPGRKLADAAERHLEDPAGDYAFLGFGTDWGALASAWFTEYERTRDPKFRDRLLASMKTIGTQPRGFFTGSARLNLVTGAFEKAKDNRVSVSHLSAAFGLPEICAELIESFDVPEFERAWLQYCELYNAPAAEQKAALGQELKGNNLQQGHARLTAFAAYRKKDATLAARAWKEFGAGSWGYGPQQEFESRRIEAPAVLNPVDESAGISTNSSAQWGLAGIVLLAYARGVGR